MHKWFIVDNDLLTKVNCGLAVKLVIVNCFDIDLSKAYIIYF